MVRWVSLLMLASGGAALIYQVSWLRLLGLSVGSTATATALILTAFFGGLTLGSLLAQRLLRQGWDGLKGFMLAELVIALSGLLLLPVMFHSALWLGWLPGAKADSVYGFLAVFLLLMLPTTAMGASFPFISAWVAEVRQTAAQSIGFLYAMNALGSAGGILLAGFYLILQFGLSATIYMAVGLNLFSALLASWMMWHLKSEPKNLPYIAKSSPSQAWRYSPLLWVAAVTGFCLMALEVVWTKYLTIYLGTTLHSFALMTASVLLGLMIGALLMQWLFSRFKWGERHLVALLLGLVFTLVLTRAVLGELPNLLPSEVYLGELANSIYSVAFIALLLPSSVLFGVTFPFVLALYCRDSVGVRQDLGLAYAINTLAAIVGAMVTALWLIPQWGTDASLLFLALLPLLAVLLIIPTFKSVIHQMLGYGLVLSLVVVGMFSPGVNYQTVFSKHFYRYANKEAPVNYRYFGEGKTGVVSLVDYGSDLVHLHKNGLREATIFARHAYKGTLAESLLAALPYLLQDNPQNAFVVGFGGGTTARVLVNSGLAEVKTVEIEPHVVKAMLQVGEGQFAFMHRSGFSLEYNDARVSLQADKNRYSIIASQPSHPWLAGSGNLYSKQFFELVRSRLKEDGVFAQWVNLFRMDSDTLRSILATFYEVFPQGVVFGVMSSGDLLLMGSANPLVLDYERTVEYFNNTAVTNTLRYGDLRYVHELPSYFLFTSVEARKIAYQAQLATDDNLLIEMRLARFSKVNDLEQDPYALLRQYIQTDIRRYQRE